MSQHNSGFTTPTEVEGESLHPIIAGASTPVTIEQLERIINRTVRSTLSGFRAPTANIDDEDNTRSTNQASRSTDKSTTSSETFGVDQTPGIAGEGDVLPSHFTGKVCAKVSHSVVPAGFKIPPESARPLADSKHLKLPSFQDEKKFVSFSNDFLTYIKAVAPE